MHVCITCIPVIIDMSLLKGWSPLGHKHKHKDVRPHWKFSDISTSTRIRRTERFNPCAYAYALVRTSVKACFVFLWFIQLCVFYAWELNMIIRWKHWEKEAKHNFALYRVVLPCLGIAETCSLHLLFFWKLASDIYSILFMISFTKT